MTALRARIDPVFLPRPLRLIDALPRNEVGKLTREAALRAARLPPRRFS
jgi:acyl-coenzyme A synthetase/AMP-(fatty) acid ligase